MSRYKVLVSVRLAIGVLFLMFVIVEMIRAFLYHPRWFGVILITVALLFWSGTKLPRSATSEELCREMCPNEED